MRVMLVGPSARGKGGISTVIRAYSGLLEHSQVDPQVVSTHPGVRQRTFGVAVDSVRATRYAVDAIRRERPDVVHLFVGPRGSLLRKLRIALAARRIGSGVVTSFHSGELDDILLNGGIGLTRWALDRLIAASDVVTVLYDRLLDSPLRSPMNHWVRVGNPCTVPTTVVGWDSRHVDVAFVGRLAHEKGAALLSDLASGLSDCGYTIAVAGEGTDTEGRQAFETLGTLRGVTRMGWLSPHGVSDLLASTRVLVLPSRHESLPMSVLEAGGAGCCVIASPAGALTEVLDCGRGVIVDAREPKPWIEAVAGVLGHPEDGARCATSLRAYVATNYAPDVILGQLLDVYERAREARAAR